ncbi:MAG TPA: hypothetical protein VHQ00_10935, partial [Chloroflexota bacterium]|nr:hypothetical protein [Chloroflexota bacterium]
VNLLRYLLDAGDEAGVTSADLDDGDGYTGVTVLRVGGVRCTLETGSLRYHRWDEHTQAYFQEGWVHTWAPPLLLRNAVAEVEVYRASGGDAEPIASSAGTEGPGDSGRAAGAVRHTVSRPLAEPRWSWAYRREAEHFLAGVRSGAPFRSSGEDTHSDVRLLEEVYRTWLQR